MIRRWLAALMVETFVEELANARAEGYASGHTVGYERGLEESFDTLVAAGGYAAGAARRGAKESFRALLTERSDFLR